MFLEFWYFILNSSLVGFFGRDSSIFFSFIFTFDGVHTNFLVVLLEGSQVLTCFRELSFFHTFSNIPVNESTLSIHKIKLMIQTCPSFSNSSGVRQHANSTLHLGKVSSWNNGWWLIVDTNFETSWAPVYELDGSLGLDCCNSSINILGNNIASV